jgi:hypothetical protein
LLLLVLGDQGKAQHVALSKKAEVNENVPTLDCLDVQNSSDLPNGTPRFQEYTCDGDIATNENAAASNDDGEKDEDVYNEVNNVEINLTASRTLSERDDGDVDINASLVLEWECANDASNEEADNLPSTSMCKSILFSGCSYFLLSKYFISLMFLIAFVSP